MSEVTEYEKALEAFEHTRREVEAAELLLNRFPCCSSLQKGFWRAVAEQDAAREKLDLAKKALEPASEPAPVNLWPINPVKEAARLYSVACSKAHEEACKVYNSTVRPFEAAQANVRKNPDNEEMQDALEIARDARNKAIADADIAGKASAEADFAFFGF